MKQTACPVVSNAEIMPGVHLMWIEAPDMACSVQPGQFITVQCGDCTLRRPFSVHQVSSSDIALLFKVTGKGTIWLSQQQSGERIDVLGPLGNGFTVPPMQSGQSKHLLLVAGGIGIAPLVFLMQYASSQHQVTLIHGASTAAQLYPWSILSTGPSSVGRNQSKPASLPERVQFIPVTEDGSMGKKGMVTDILPDFLDQADQVYACGPLQMYEAMAGVTCHSECSEESHGTPGWLGRESKLKKCQVSLEVRMGCGFGACYGCTINTAKGLKQICRNGPVFELDDIIWQEVKL